jgi:hypothetical protein
MMDLYLAMWVRGIQGINVSPEQMKDNKLYAMSKADELRHFLESFHEIVIPHDDETLELIDALWLNTRDPRLIPMAMERCFTLIDKCQGIVLFHRGHMSEGMSIEKQYAEERGYFVYEAHDLTDEIKEDLVLALNEYEER